MCKGHKQATHKKRKCKHPVKTKHCFQRASLPPFKYGFPRHPKYWVGQKVCSVLPENPDELFDQLKIYLQF